MGQIISESKSSGWDDLWNGLAAGLSGYARGKAISNMYPQSQQPGGPKANFTPNTQPLQQDAAMTPQNNTAMTPLTARTTPLTGNNPQDTIREALKMMPWLGKGSL